MKQAYLLEILHLVCTLWSPLLKTLRRMPAISDAYTRRGFGLILSAMDEAESALRREWSP
ncbi:hypothetical protein [Rhodanobacter sp. A1T4]|uniref:hypothetical protein n=1 Tax=Rhodanobacter sp. A1T4 TaxID=2723087 RepID=UPI0017BA03C0|nr:hypothetical protein [Rhodanobacter sp. A1T4]